MNKQENIETLIAQCAEDRGVTEIPRGSNRGPRIAVMLRNTGLGEGYPWCAAAVATWGVEALGKLWPVPLTADCDTVLNWAKRKGVLQKSDPQRGDLFLVMKSDWDAIHIGVVTDVVDSSTIRAWEGNTNDGGSREGYGVFHRNRSRHNLWYVRWADAMEVPIPEIQSPRFAVWVSPHGLFPSVQSIEGRPYAPVRALVAAILGVSLEATADVVGWDAGKKAATVRGKLMTTFMSGTTALAPVREIGEALGCVIGAGETEDGKTTVTIGPPQQSRQARTEL
jgi:hypothetical protein